jgi:hypothetical protein
MASAAMTPRESATACRPFCFPELIDGVMRIFRYLPTIQTAAPRSMGGSSNSIVSPCFVP